MEKLPGEETLKEEGQKCARAQTLYPLLHGSGKLINNYRGENGGKGRCDRAIEAAECNKKLIGLRGR